MLSNPAAAFERSRAYFRDEFPTKGGLDLRSTAYRSDGKRAAHREWGRENEYMKNGERSRYSHRTACGRIHICLWPLPTANSRCWVREYTGR